MNNGFKVSFNVGRTFFNRNNSKGEVKPNYLPIHDFNECEYYNRQYGTIAIADNFRVSCLCVSH